MEKYCWVKTQLVREPEAFYAAKIKSPEDVYNVIEDQLELSLADREHFITIYLNRKNKVNAIEIVSIGTAFGTLVSPSEVFKPALLTSSLHVILVHNHPSGDSTPSNDDIKTTSRLKEAGEILGIEVLDHIIIGDKEYCSLAEKSLI